MKSVKKGNDEEKKEEKKVLVRDLLDTPDGFDIMNIDLTEIAEAVEKIPSNGIIDINIAEKLATNWLRTADRCGELLAKAIRWKGIKDTEKKSEFTQAGLRTGQSSATAQKQLAPMDGEYIKKANEYTDAEALCILLQQKYQTLMAAHHLAREIVRRHSQGEVAEGRWYDTDFDEDLE